MSSSGEVMATQWYYVGDEDEYFSVAKKQLSEFGYRMV